MTYRQWNMMDEYHIVNDAKEQVSASLANRAIFLRSATNLFVQIIILLSLLSPYHQI